MAKLGLASNFQDEIENIEPIWEIFKDVVDLWTVVDSGSTDGTQDKLRELVGDRLNLIESDMIKVNGYGYARTKLIELSKDMDWVLIWDGDERMSPANVVKLKMLTTLELPYDVIWLPRCHFQSWDMTKVEYGSMDKLGADWREAIRINPDWQARLIRRTMLEGKSKIHFKRRVHEQIQGIQRGFNDPANPTIFHFGWMKTDERKKQIVELCNKLWDAEQAGEVLDESYEEASKREGWGNYGLNKLI